MKPTHFKRAMLAVAVAGALAACSGGSSSGSSASTVSRGVVTAFGSIVVNGVHFDETGSKVSINDASGSGDHRGIKLGMTVKIRGSSDGATGVASSIEAEHEVEGAIASISGSTFVVHGQTVTTDAQTLYEDIPGSVFGGLTVGMKVEVYGLRDASGIHATRIELEDAADFEDEVRGVVSNLNLTPNTFNIGTLLVHYDNTTTVEDGAVATDLVNGAIVEVHLDSTNHATKIEFEDNEDDEFHSDGMEVEAEGYISNYDSVAGTFMIGDVRVRVTGTTDYEGVGALANNVKVEAEGTMVDGVLVASEIEYEDD